MTVGRVVALGVAALLVALAVTLAGSDERQAGANSILESFPVAELPDGGFHCQGGETIPKDAGAVRVLMGTFGRPAPEITVIVRGGDGAPVTRGRRPAGGREGHVDIPLRRVERTTTGAQVCIQVNGVPRAVLYGQGASARLYWLRPGSESWYALIPTVAHRFALGKASLFGSLWLLVVAAVVLAACALAVRLLLRELGTGA